MAWRPQRTDTGTDAPPRTTADTLGTAQNRIIHALAEARRVRHHRDCHCRLFDDQWCNAADALWTRAVNRELDQIALDSRDSESP